MRQKSPRSKKQILGHWGEEVASRYLQRHGYQVVDRNVLYRCGEIDIVAIKNHSVIFCEVKTKVAQDYAPEEQVTIAKVQKICRAAQLYLRTRRAWEYVEWQIDVIAITRSASRVRLVHFTNITQELDLPTP